MRKTILLSFIATTALAGCGEFGDFAPLGQETLTALDANTQLARENFHNADVDGDDYLSKSEYSNWRFSQLRFKVAPTPATVTTFMAGYGRDFDRMDTNHDKQLDLNEFSAKIPGVTEPRPQRQPGLPQLHPFTGLTVTAIQALPVRCPCFALLAKSTGKRVRVEFHMGYGETASVRGIDKVTVNGEAVTDQNTWRLVGEGLDGAALKTQDPRVQQVADALKGQ